MINQAACGSLDFRSLCGCVGPGLVDGEGFVGCGGAGGTWMKPGGDEQPAEFDDHVEVGRFGFGGVPGCVSAAGGDVVVVIGGGEGVPAGDQAVGDESEGDGAFDGAAGAVAGLAEAGDLFGVVEGDFDGPAGRVAGDDRFGGVVRSVVTRARS